MQYGAGQSEWLTCRCANASLTDNVEREGEKIKGKSRRQLLGNLGSVGFAPSSCDAHHVTHFAASGRLSERPAYTGRRKDDTTTR